LRGRVGVEAGKRGGSGSSGRRRDEAIVALTRSASASSPAVRHFEYVFDDGTVYVYDMDSSQQLVQTISLPQTEAGVRGVTVAPASHLVFISYGGDSAGYSGSVLAYDLLTEQVVWTFTWKRGSTPGRSAPTDRAFTCRRASSRRAESGMCWTPRTVP
jgi:WD40 repeat protein